MPGASQAGAWHTKHSLLTTNYEPKSPSRRASDQSDEKIVIVRGALKGLCGASPPYKPLTRYVTRRACAVTVLGGLAEFERELIRTRTSERRARAVGRFFR